jgi:hypothetical protein
MATPTARRQNPLEDFVTHGFKTVGDYEYQLLVDALGTCYIQRLKSDDTDYKFCKLPHVDGTFAQIASAIDAFWVDPSSADKVYSYIFLTGV